MLFRSLIRSLFTFAVLISLLVWSNRTTCLAAPLAKHVVIISIDGFAGYLLDDPKAPVPTIRKLAKDGGYVANGMKVSLRSRRCRPT